MNKQDTSQQVAEKRRIWATGRRKESVAKVEIIWEGKGRFMVNGREFEKYFTWPTHREYILQPLKLSGLKDKIDIKVKVNGGGVQGQAGAIRLGISRALVELNPDFKTTLRKEGFLTRDPRAKERKKYGQRGARRKFQWTKR